MAFASSAICQGPFGSFAAAGTHTTIGRGLPWHEYMATFVQQRDTAQPAAITSHEEQMRASRCYLASESKLGCISCHNPHEKPNSEVKAGYFRERCNACHGNAGCKELEANRARTTPADNCLACHMPAMPTRVQHAAMTDHGIPRRANAAPTVSAERRASGWPLTLFHRDLVDPDTPEAQRDRAVALLQFMYPAEVGQQILKEAVEILSAAIKRDPHDFDAREALAHSQFALNRTADALATVETGIEQSPRHEQLLAGAMLFASASRQWHRAQEYADRLIDINPNQIRYRQIAVQIAIGQRDAAPPRKPATKCWISIPPTRKSARRWSSCCGASGAIARRRHTPRF